MVLHLSKRLLSSIAVFCLVYSYSCSQAQGASTIPREEHGILNSFSSLMRSARFEWELFVFVNWKLEKGTCKSENQHYDDGKLLANLQDFVDDFASSTLKHLEGIEHSTVDVLTDSGAMEYHVASNFILVYRMTYRFAKYGDYLKDFISSDGDKHDSGVCNISRVHTQFPGVVEHGIVISTFTMTYKIHDLYVSPNVMVKELTGDSTTPTGLTAAMAADISDFAARSQYFVQAFDWINYAISLVSEGDSSMSRFDLLVRKVELVNAHNNGFEDLSRRLSHYYTRELDPHEIGTPSELGWERRKVVLDLELSRHPKNVWTRMWSLCAGFRFQSDQVLSKLKCFSDTRSHAWLTVNPLYVEVLSENPDIFKFHKILGEKLIADIVNKMESSGMKPSRIMSGSNVLFRSSVQSWFENEEFPELTRITEVVSGLKVRNGASEPFQAVEYVVGRHYVMHHDVVNRPWDAGLRMSTMLFYLNDVEMGGATAFGNAGVANSPDKGSAVFWHSLYANGTPRLDVLHCACPVIRGRKLGKLSNQPIYSSTVSQLK